MNYVNDLEG